MRTLTRQDFIGIFPDDKDEVKYKEYLNESFEKIVLVIDEVQFIVNWPRDLTKNDIVKALAKFNKSFDWLNEDKEPGIDK